LEPQPKEERTREGRRGKEGGRNKIREQEEESREKDMKRSW
jgi:hypothetical protein